MLAAKLREATTEDAQELYELALSSIKNVHTNDYEQKVLLEEFSKENIKTWLEEESIKVFVATYMGFIIGCCVYRGHFFSNLLISENYQHLGVASSLWGFARDNALVSGKTDAFKGAVSNKYVQEITDNHNTSLSKAVEETSFLEQKGATENEVKEAKKTIRLWNISKKQILYSFLANLVVFWFFYSGAVLYVFSPNKALQYLAFDAKDEYFYRGSKSLRHSETFSKWKVDLLLWRGAEPIYKDDIGECAGAVGVAIMWYQPELLKYLTKKMTREEKLTIPEKCASLTSKDKTGYKKLSCY